MPLSNTRELKEDVLFRASEPISGSSAWNVKAIDYLNRVYRTLAAGASEFLPEYVDDWWWMRASGTLLLDPCYYTGLVTATKGDVNISFTVPPNFSMAGRRLRIQDHPDVFVIETHLASDPLATLDEPWTGETTAIAFWAMKVEYELDVEAQVLSSPMIAFRRPHRIIGMPPERMDELYPLVALGPGIPQAFSLEDEGLVRFSHGGRTDDITQRVEYRYRPTVVDLTDAITSVPLVPPQWMHVLSDMALVYVLMDKNDDRSNAVALGARTGLAAMLKDNRRRNTKIDSMSGHIAPRPLEMPVGSGPRAGSI